MITKFARLGYWLGFFLTPLIFLIFLDALMKQSPKYKKNLLDQNSFDTKQLARLNDIEQLAIAKYMGD